MDKEILIITQKVDIKDDVLGFMHRWILEFSKQSKKVTVICLFKGEYDFPENVKVLSLGKEEGKGRLTYLYRLFKYVVKYRKDYKNVFVHMNQIYVILCGFIWKFMGKRIGLWYAHGSVSLSLRLATLITDMVFSSTTSGYRLENKKIKIVGQGIDVMSFNEKETFNDPIKLVSVGRVSKVKDYMSMVKAVKTLKDEGLLFSLDLYGSPILDMDFEYKKELEEYISSNGLGEIVNLKGSVSNDKVGGVLLYYDVFLNMSQTGSLDKAILEAMSSKLLVITSNESAINILNEIGYKYLIESEDFSTLKDYIKEINSLDRLEKKRLGESLRNIVLKNHSIDRLIKRVLKFYS
jgi:glycosyltransferase involved in cell wall biosynthesis